VVLIVVAVLVMALSSGCSDEPTFDFWAMGDKVGEKVGSEVFCEEDPCDK
jgi:hypothetical protein